jgi:hypothetical protein
MKIPQVQSEINFEVVNSYTTDLSGIYNIITVDDKSTWGFCDTYDNNIVTSHMDSLG